MTAIGLLFPGQGAQAVGMAADLLKRSPTATKMFADASEVLGYDLAELCLQGPDSELNQTDRSQPALFVHSMAALAELRENRQDFDSQVVAVAGLSLGEYSALCAAGAIEFQQGVNLVRQRGAAMQSASLAVKSGMASVIGLEEAKVQELCDASVEEGEVLKIANLLCPGNIAISGHSKSLENAAEKAEQFGAMKFIPLSVAGAFHTDIMAPASQHLSHALTEVRMKPARFPVFCNVDAQPHLNPEEFRQLFPRQLVSPVQWEASLRSMMDAGVEEFYEIGTGRVLAGTLKRVNRKVKCENVG